MVDPVARPVTRGGSDLRDGHPHPSEVAVLSFGRCEPRSALSLHLKLLMGMVIVQ